MSRHGKMHSSKARRMRNFKNMNPYSPLLLRPKRVKTKSFECVIDFQEICMEAGFLEQPPHKQEVFDHLVKTTKTVLADAQLDAPNKKLNVVFTGKQGDFVFGFLAMQKAVHDMDINNLTLQLYPFPPCQLWGHCNPLTFRSNKPGLGGNHTIHFGELLKASKLSLQDPLNQLNLNKLKQGLSQMIGPWHVGMTSLKLTFKGRAPIWIVLATFHYARPRSSMLFYESPLAKFVVFDRALDV